MNIKRTQLIAWYSGKFETRGDYLVKYSNGKTSIAYWDPIDGLLGEDGYVVKTPVVEWTPLP